MTYRYQALKRKNFKTDETLYYPAPAAATVVGIDQIAAEISERCTVTRADAVGIINELEAQVKRALLDGNTVRLGSLGSFRMTVSALSVDTRDEVTADLVRSVRVRYTPSTWIKNKLQLGSIHFKRIN